MKYLLVDNGSLRPDSVLSLRRLAASLSAQTGLEVVPASLLHSSKVDPERLKGIPAVNLERRIRFSLESGERAFTVLPFFFGPTGAIVDYLPERIASLRERFGHFEVKRAPFLFDRENPDADNTPLVEILMENVQQVILENKLNMPRVALVDHGSPLESVNQVRNQLAGMLQERLGSSIGALSPASMERREGSQYDFNEPLLENLLTQDGWRESEVVVSMLFLSPGRHAGPGGDIDTICKTAEQKTPG
jgi:sirohydrochlorin ferrochelatase